MKHWWKFLGIVLIVYSIIFGLIINVPDLPIIHQSIRNIFFHVCMWFNMIVLLSISFVYSIKYLYNNNLNNDIISKEAATTGILFGILGIVTGMVWAKFTWGVWWLRDPKLDGVALAMISYVSYFILRNSITDQVKKARIASVYNIFAFVFCIIFIIIYPKLSQSSIHPGDNGNVFGGTINNNIRLVFYPAIIGWIIISIWIFNLRVRYYKLIENI
jgi:heme exporter protein C